MPDIHKKHGQIVIDGQCLKCGDATLEVSQGKPPHMGRYDCVKCGAFAGWASRIDMFVIEALKSGDPLRAVMAEYNRVRDGGLNPAIPSVIAARIAWEKDCEKLASYVGKLSVTEKLEAQG